MNLGGFKDMINGMLSSLVGHGDNFVPHGDIGPQGIAVGEFNPAIPTTGKPPEKTLSLGPADTNTKGCPTGYTKVWGMNEGTKWAYCNKGSIPAGLHAFNARVWKR